MDDIMKKPVSVPSTILVSLCYCYFISLRTPKGFLRLISLLPVLYHFTILPLYLSPGFFLVLETALFIWPSGIRLGLFAFGKGPLSQIQPSQSLYNFIVYASLPIRNSSSKQPSYQYKKKLPMLVAMIAIVFVVNQMKVHMHYILLLTSFFIVTFIYVDIIVQTSLNVVLHCLGLELEVMFYEPYASTSLQDFWGKRWNITVSELLRQAVYKPVRSASVAFLGIELARQVAILATFLASGLVHELLVYSYTLSKPSWETTGFFVLHGICVVLEVGLKTSLKGRLDLPRFVSVPLTLGFIFLTSVCLFFPPLERIGVDVLAIQELRSFIDLLKEHSSCAVFFSWCVTKLS